MTFTWPFWLILIIPIVVTFWLRPLRTRGLTILHAITLGLLLLALCGLSIVLPSRNGCIVLVADRSLSMPSGSQDQQAEAAELLYRAMGAGDELAVVSFGQRAAVEQPPQHARFSGFMSDVGNEASNLAEGLERAISLIPRDSPGRILLISDGNTTGGDVAAAAARAASAGVSIDYRPLGRQGVGDLAIDHVDAPSSVAAAEAFMISGWVESPRAQEVSYELVFGDQVLTKGKRTVPAGRSRLVFRDKAGDAGARQYVLRVRAAGNDDQVMENNSARFLVGVRGAKPLLCVSPAGSSLPELLSAGGLKIDRRLPEQCAWSLADLAGFTAVLIEDIPASKIGTAGMETLAAWITEAGGGLLTTGGRNAYGTGGYFKSALERVLPVSMELRREHRKLSLAIVVALDRSGSMAIPVPGGRSKMDLADLATAEVLNQLSGADQFGCLAVDSISHEIVPLSDLSDTEAMRNKILGIDSGGGGIFVYEALQKAAAMIASASAGTRHIILFSDANDSEEPGDYINLVDQIVKAGITVSVIGLGTERDRDSELLKDIARRGGGQCMFTEDAHELPRLFAQDTFLVARSSFLEDPTTVRTTAGMIALTAQPWGELPQVGGYNLCYLRPEANLAAVTVDDYQAPLVATWQAGLGRVLSYTGQADGQYTGALGKWPQVGEFFSSLARWVSAQEQGLGPDMLLTQELRGGTCHVELHLDSEREKTPFAAVPQLSVLLGKEGQKPAAEHVPLRWTTADVLSADVPLRGEQTLLTSLELPGIGRATLPPVCLPYSPEFAPRPEGEGLRTLERLARTTGGVERINLADAWGDLPKRPRYVNLAPWLSMAAMLLLLAEVLQRRTGLLTSAVRLLKMPALVRTRGEVSADGTPTGREAATPATRPAAVPLRTAPVARAAAPSAEAPAAPAPQPPPASDEKVIDALSEARQRAARRTQR
ncbi:MAG TPA: vWA domain-containing protein [Pirellulales bacterium]|nr:vWA domain-containing protein [Pirellulales bacterium]